MADLCQLSDVKAWLTIASGVTANDALLSRLITAVSLEFLREIGRTDFYPAADYTETREGDGDVRMVLRHWPVNSIASMTIAGTSIAASSDQIEAGYYIDTGLDPERLWELYLAGGLVFTDAAPIVVTYNAGYSSVPADAAQAVIEWVGYRYKSQQWIGTTSAHVQGESVQTQIAVMPPTVQAVINRYRRVYPGLDQKTDASQTSGSKGTILNPRNS